MTVYCYHNVVIKRYTIRELCDGSGLNSRTVHYYVQEGLIEPPAGRGRGAFYSDSHMDELLQIKSLQERGLKLAVIRDVLAGRAADDDLRPSGRELWARYPISAGVELHIARGIEEAKRKDVDEVVRMAKALLGRQTA